MKKHMAKIISCALALCMMCAMSVSAFAAEASDITNSGGSGSVPVNLTTTNGGIGGDPGDITPTKLSVTVPTALPMAMTDGGNVTTATDCKIINNSYGAVRVSSMTIEAVNGWKLTSFGDKTTLAGEKVDSNKLGFAIGIGGGAMKLTDNSNAVKQQLLSSPVRGCYMTGVGDSTGNTATIEYAAIVTPLSTAVENATVANVVFIIEWDTEG